MRAISNNVGQSVGLSSQECMGSYSFGHLAFQLCVVSPELDKQAGALGMGQAARTLHDVYIQTC